MHVYYKYVYFESLTMYRNTRRAGCVSEKAQNSCIREFRMVIFVKVKWALVPSLHIPYGAYISRVFNFANFANFESFAKFIQRKFWWPRFSIWAARAFTKLFQRTVKKTAIREKLDLRNVSAVRYGESTDPLIYNVYTRIYMYMCMWFSFSCTHLHVHAYKDWFRFEAS